MFNIKINRSIAIKVYIVCYIIGVLWMRREGNKHDPAIELLALCLFAKKNGEERRKNIQNSNMRSINFPPVLFLLSNSKEHGIVCI
jgi:hypothetical protein